MKTVELTDYTNQTPSKHFERKKKCSRKEVQDSPKMTTLFMKCAPK